MVSHAVKETMTTCWSSNSPWRTVAPGAVAPTSAVSRRTHVGTSAEEPTKSRTRSSTEPPPSSGWLRRR